MRTALPEETKRTIFAELVAIQDEGTPVRESRSRVARKYGLDVADVKTIEREGLDEEWEPL